MTGGEILGRSDEVYDSGIEKTKQYGEGVGKSAKNTVDAGTRKVSQAVRRQIHNNIRKKAGSGSRNTLRGKRNNIVEKGGKAVRKTVRGVSNGVKGLNSSGSVGSAGRSMASNGAKVGAKATRAGAKAVANATKFIVKVAPKVAKAVFNVLKEAITAIVKFCVACPLVALVILVLLLIVLLVVSVVKSTKDDNVLFNNFDNRVRNEVKYTTNEDGDKVAVVESYSSKNAAILAYYKTMSERSVWELKDDGTLVNLADEEASKDHLKREDLVEVNPILLYYLNDTFYGDTLVYPEQFVQPVAFDKDKMELKDIVNDKEKVTVESPVLSKKTGQPKGDKTSKSLSAYGLGSVVTFTDTVIYSSVEGNYVQKEVWDEEKSEVVVEEINEPFHFDKGSKSVRVMDEAITFAGKIKFGYSNTLKLTKAVTDGESTDEESNVKQIIYDTKKVEVYTAQKDGIVVTGKTKKWCEKNEYRIISEPIEKEIKLHKIRSSTSGLYSSALTPTVVEPAKGENNYLKD